MKDVAWESMTVRDLVVRHPEALAILETMGVDYCCGGGQKLPVAAKNAHVDFEALIRAVKEAFAAPRSLEEGTRDWSVASIKELADHIQSRHHSYLRTEFPRIESLIKKVRRAHEKNHGPMLQAVAAQFDALRAETEAHLVKEEQVLFPYIRKLDIYVIGGGPKPTCPFGSVEAPIRQLEREHDNAGSALRTIEGQTSSYRPPEDACPAFRSLFESLKALQADLHEHIHLENNILFPAARKLEGV